MNNLERQVQGVQNGLCDGFYAMNTSMLQGQNALQSQICQGLNGANNNIAENRHAAGTPTIVLGKPGLYYVSFEADALPSAAGTITVALQNNNVTIPGAITSITGTAATTTRIILDAIVEVRPSCCAVDNTKNLTFNNGGVETAYTNATVSVIKLC